MEFPPTHPTHPNSDSNSNSNMNNNMNNNRNSNNLNEREPMVVAGDKEQLRVMMALLESKGIPPSHRNAKAILDQIRKWKELGLGYLGIRKQNLKTWTEHRAYELYPE